MNEFLTVIGFACLPALGNFTGGLIAEFLKPSPRNLNRALHAAAGIVIAIVAVELMPEALKSTPAWVIALAFALGRLAYPGLEELIKCLRKNAGDGAGDTGMWMIYIAVAADLFSDGLMIGAGSAVSYASALWTKRSSGPVPGSSRDAWTNS